MTTTTTKLTASYRGETLAYELFYELFDFVAEQRPDLDVDADFATIERIAQRLDRRAGL